MVLDQHLDGVMLAMSDRELKSISCSTVHLSSERLVTFHILQGNSQFARRVMAKLL